MAASFKSLFRRLFGAGKARSRTELTTTPGALHNQRASRGVKFRRKTLRLQFESLELRLAPAIQAISVAADGTLSGDGNSLVYDGVNSFSSDGRYVVFSSGANNLVAGDANGKSDIFVRDLQTGITKLVSTNAGGTQGNASSVAPSISRDGRFVVFMSSATNLVSGDTNGFPDLFAKDLQTGAITRISTDSTGQQRVGSNFYSVPAISDDDRFVVFATNEADLVSGDTNNLNDVFLKDLHTGAISRISTTSGGAQANGASDLPVITGDGRLVFFRSSATNLVSDDTQGKQNLFMKNLLTGAVMLVSTDTDGNPSSADINFPVISRNGRYVAFSTTASLIATDTNALSDVYWKDLATGTIRLVSTTSSAALEDGASFNPSLSDDGRFVAFASKATNLVAGDTNESQDVFLKDLTTGIVTRASLTSSGQEINGDSQTPSLSGDGKKLLFYTGNPNVVPGDTNGNLDIFLATAPPATTTTLTSSSTVAHLSTNLTFTATVSGGSTAIPDGETVTFKDGAATLGTDTLKAGVAQYSTSTLPAGTHSITVLYGGDTNYGSSVSPVLRQTVLRPAIVVTTAADEDDGSPDPAKGAGTSLREAINTANANPGFDSIAFGISGAGVKTINLASELDITDPVYIDGYSQPGTQPNTNGPGLADNAVLLIQLVQPFGSDIGSGVLTIATSDTTVRGLAMNVVIAGNNNLIAGNFIGTNAAGTAAVGGFNGIYIDGDNNIVGGTAPADRNLISGNGANGLEFHSGDGFTVQGNLIGTDATGKIAVPNLGRGVWINASDAIVGGATAAAANVISATSFGEGILVDGGATGVEIEGNLIGTDITGAANLGNGGAGIILGKADNNRIEHNTIAFNGVNASGAGSNDGIVLVREFDANRTGNLITKNSIFANANLGIDLGAGTSGFGGDGVTVNDSGDIDTGPNSFLNFPVLQTASIAGGNLTVTGFARPGATIELFIAAADTTNFGEGKTYLTTVMEGSSADTDATTGTYGPAAVNSLNQGTDTTNRFSFTVPLAGLPAGVVGGAKLTTTAIDSSGNTSEFSGVVTVQAAANTPPTADAKSITGITESTSANVTLSGSDAELCDLTFTIVSSPANGTLGTLSDAPCTSGNPNHDTATIKYTPFNFYNGSDSFTYKVNDGVVDSPVATVSLTIDPVNQAPKADPKTVTLTQDSSKTIPLSGTDIETCGLTFSVVAQPSHGSLSTITPGGCLPSGINTGHASVVYTPAAGYSGPDSFTYKVTDGGDPSGCTGGAPACSAALDSAPATVSITVNPLVHTFIVNSIGDAPDADTTDKICQTATTGECTLRAAIQQANASSGADKIQFNIAGTGLHTITPASALPDITDSVTIDGYSQPGASQNTLATGDNAVLLIELNGASAGPTDGLLIDAVNCTVTGLVINRFVGSGIILNFHEGNNADGAVIDGNFIGTDSAGAQALANGYSGVQALGATNVVIGGTAPAARNILSGNGNDGLTVDGDAMLIQGNYIGVDATGKKALGNAELGIDFGGASSGAIGGAFAGAGNVISANDFGLKIDFSDSVLVQGNLIGTDVTGTADLGNHNGAVEILRGQYLQILQNTIAFNKNAPGIGLVKQSPFAAGPGNVISQNNIFSNGTIPIDLGNDGPTANDLTPTPDIDSGPNQLQNFPVINYATTDLGKLKVSYNVPSAPNFSTYPLHIEFFLNDHYIIDDTFTKADYAAGGKTVILDFPASSIKIGSTALAATATDSLTAGAGLANTSEFSSEVPLYTPWRNPGRLRWDVNNDTFVSADDVVAVINYINAHGSGAIPPNAANQKPYLDVDNDGNVVAMDVLDIINYINAGRQQGGEAEAYQPTSNNDVLALIAADVAAQTIRKRK